MMITTEQIAELLIAAVREMSPEQKAELRALIDRNLKRDLNQPPNRIRRFDKRGESNQK